MTTEENYFHGNDDNDDKEVQIIRLLPSSVNKKFPSFASFQPKNLKTWLEKILFHHRIASPRSKNDSFIISRRFFLVFGLHNLELDTAATAAKAARKEFEKNFLLQF